MLGHYLQHQETKSTLQSQLNISRNGSKPRRSETSPPELQKFFWQNIACRFGVPKEVTVDNGKQFDYATFREFSTQLGTNLCFASVYHLQSNGVVERANDIIFAGIKKNIT